MLPSQKTKRETEDSDSGSLIVYNGAMVDVGSMLQKLDKSEKAREEIEQKLMKQDTKMGKTLSHCHVSMMLQEWVVELLFYVEINHFNQPND